MNVNIQAGTGIIFLLSLASLAAAADQNDVVKADVKGLSIASADGNFDLQVRGLLHVDGRLFADDDVAGEDDDSCCAGRDSASTGDSASTSHFACVPNQVTG